MNYRLVSRLLGIVALLIGAAMVFSLPWAHPWLGRRDLPDLAEHQTFETRGFLALVASIAVCWVVGALLMWLGRKSKGRMFRKEALAVVGLSWIMATALGALPFYFGHVYRCASVRLIEGQRAPLIYEFNALVWQHWVDKNFEQTFSDDELRVLEVLLDAKAIELAEAKIIAATGWSNAADLFEGLKQRDEDWHLVLIARGEEEARDDRANNYRIRWVAMGVADCLFESQSGFSTTGATVIADLEDVELVPHCILFWRSSSHFLGGVGIIVLFVTILGQGAIGKAMMRAEMPGPTKEGPTARMQHTAWLIAAIYAGLNLALATILFALGMTPFDALCHAFGTMATGGFSTYNASVGHFNSAAVDYTIVVFMILAGSNFTLLYFLLARQPSKLLGDTEWRVYMFVLASVSVLVVFFGVMHGDFGGYTATSRLGNGLRYGVFQVVSIMTTTGYGTHDFDDWNSFGRGALFLLMFVGGCAGSTGGGLKVIRHVMFLKIIWLELEKAFHPGVVRPLRVGGRPVEDPDLRRNILVYFGIILAVFVFSWLFVVTVEPDTTWGKNRIEHKLIDSASGVAATLNNIGPGLGIVGATQNYTHFSPPSKILFLWLMMVGRLEIYAILVLFIPGFWRRH